MNKLLISTIMALSLTTASAQTTDARGPQWLHDAVFYQIYPSSYMDTDGNGIAVLKDSFESALEASLSDQSVRGYDNFNAEDAARLRALVYETDKLVRCDEALLGILKTEARAYFAGQISLDEAASRTQSRASLYLAEQR